jgi:uncharacterized protein (DUF736 family)
MNAEEVYSEHQAWLDDYENSQEWEHEQQLLHQRYTEKKMAYEQKDDTITLWMNDKKSKDTDPLMTGKGLVKGKEVRAAAWKNISRAGSSYMNIKISEPQDNAQRFDQAPSRKEQPSEVPF